ncbi:acyl-CoA mutase large subunit family protein [Ferviditalea candida]|uniref:Methylmalonyl-CoA mutase family protein n=1 Tax=Ferviditalea candida TaxID=3108399 RepID=A0ABU5ZG70_9BACL|nr:methylmalonyl-CoA mutase family protein [Paenibacillaceae bacterium T2]
MKPIDERKPAFFTPSAISVKRLYLAEDVKPDKDAVRIGLPGQFPYTRGIHPSMYRSRLWTVRQYAGFGTAEETNRRLRFLLEQGQTGLSLAFDLPTQIGYDPDQPLACGEVGKVGVSIASLKDMEILLQDIPLDRVSTSMTINSPAAVLLAMYATAAEKRGIDPGKLSGTLQNDILKEFTVRGTYIFPPAPSMRLTVDVLEYCSRFLPQWNPISISGYHMREAGATAVQELAFTFSNAIAYLEAAAAKGLKIDRIAPRISFFFNAQLHLFEEIAKFRAARRLWSRIMKDRFGARNPKSMQLRFHAQTGGSALTARQPDNNIVRVTLQALAAVLGGTQSLHTNARDEALGLPTEASAAIALRTQQILAFESGIADTVDPLAGSYYIESLTDEIEQRAAEYIDTIDQIGGALRAVETGYIQREIHHAAYETQTAIERGEQTIVGINRYQTDEQVKPGRFFVHPQLGQWRKQELARLRSERNGRQVEAALAALKKAAMGDANLMPALIDAVKAYATLGEICRVLREVFGEYEETGTLEEFTLNCF